LPYKHVGAHAEKSAGLDRIGATTSSLCAIHCALMPLVITILPLIGLGFLADERVEWLLVGTCAALGIASICLGHREHKRKRAAALLCLGLSLLAVGRVSEERALGRYSVVIVVLGGLAVAASHVVNRRLCMACRTCQRQAGKSTGIETLGYQERTSTEYVIISDITYPMSGE
jgi:hypothetical protein